MPSPRPGRDVRASIAQEFVSATAAARVQGGTASGAGHGLEHKLRGSPVRAASSSAAKRTLVALRNFARKIRTSNSKGDAAEAATAVAGQRQTEALAHPAAAPGEPQLVSPSGRKRLHKARAHGGKRGCAGVARRRAAPIAAASAKKGRELRAPQAPRTPRPPRPPPAAATCKAKLAAPEAPVKKKRCRGIDAALGADLPAMTADGSGATGVKPSVNTLKPSPSKVCPAAIQDCELGGVVALLKRPAACGGRGATATVEGVKQLRSGLASRSPAPVRSSSGKVRLELAAAEGLGSFDADTAVRAYLYGAIGATFSSAFTAAARRAAVPQPKLRILRFEASDTRVRVVYRGDSPKQFEDKVPLWTLSQMRAFVRALSRRSTTRVVRPSLTSEAVTTRCPTLWWSLVAYLLGWRPKGGEPATDLTEEFPVAVATNMGCVLTALAEASPESLPERRATRMVDRAARKQGGA